MDAEQIQQLIAASVAKAVAEVTSQVSGTSSKARGKKPVEEEVAFDDDLDEDVGAFRAQYQQWKDDHASQDDPLFRDDPKSEGLSLFSTQQAYEKAAKGQQVVMTNATKDADGYADLLEEVALSGGFYTIKGGELKARPKQGLRLEPELPVLDTEAAELLETAFDPEKLPDLPSEDDLPEAMVSSRKEKRRAFYQKKAIVEEMYGHQLADNQMYYFLTIQGEHINFMNAAWKHSKIQNFEVNSLGATTAEKRRSEISRELSRLEALYLEAKRDFEAKVATIKADKERLTKELRELKGTYAPPGEEPGRRIIKASTGGRTLVTPQIPRVIAPIGTKQQARRMTAVLQEQEQRRQERAQNRGDREAAIQRARHTMENLSSILGAVPANRRKGRTTNTRQHAESYLNEEVDAIEEEDVSIKRVRVPVTGSGPSKSYLTVRRKAVSSPAKSQEGSGLTPTMEGFGFDESSQGSRKKISTKPSVENIEEEDEMELDTERGTKRKSIDTSAKDVGGTTSTTSSSSGPILREDSRYGIVNLKSGAYSGKVPLHDSTLFLYENRYPVGHEVVISTLTNIAIALPQGFPGVLQHYKNPKGALRSFLGWVCGDKSHGVLIQTLLDMGWEGKPDIAETGETLSAAVQQTWISAQKS